MIPHQQSLLSSPYFQSREVEADPCHIGLTRSSPSVTRIKNSQDTPTTVQRIRRKAKLHLEKKLNLQSQQKVLTSLIKIMLSQETLSYSKEVTIELFTLDSLVTLNADKLHSSRAMNAALHTKEKVFLLKTLIAELKETELERLTLKQKTKSKKSDSSNESAAVELKINNSKTAIYNAIIDVAKNGYEYHWLLNLLNNKTKILPKNIDRKQLYINKKNKLATESLKKQEARYNSKLQKLKNHNINEQEILRTISDFLFRYKTISLIRELFPDLKEAEMLQIIRNNLECQVAAAAAAAVSEPPFEQYDDELPSSSSEVNHAIDSQPTTQIPNASLNIAIPKIKMLQKHRESNTEVFWKSFDQVLSDAELKTKFEEFLFSDWNIESDFNRQLAFLSSKALYDKNLNQQYQVLSLRILHRQIQKFTSELFKYILNVKTLNTLLATAKGENWSDLQKKLDFAFDKIQADIPSTIRSYHQQYLNRKKEGAIFTRQDIREQQNLRDSLKTNANKIKVEISKTLPRRLNYVSHALHILKIYGTIDAQTILFLAQHIPEIGENQISKLTPTSSICSKRLLSPPPHFPTQTNISPPLKRKATEVNASALIAPPIPASSIDQFNNQTFSVFNASEYSNQEEAQTPQKEMQQGMLIENPLTENALAEYDESPTSSIRLQQSIQFAPEPLAFDDLSLPLGYEEEAEQTSALRFSVAEPQTSVLNLIPSVAFEEPFISNSQNLDSQNIENDQYIDFDLDLLDRFS